MRRWLLVLLALGVAWRVLRYALHFPFWGDEAFLNVNILERGYAELVRPLEYLQAAPLLFLWIQRTAYDLCGGGEYALRAFPLLAGLTALTLFAHLAWRQLEPRAAAIAVGIFSGVYYLVRHTCESKPYATDLLAATLLIWLAAQWLRTPASTRYGLANALAVIPLLWLSYPAVFVGGGTSLALLAANCRQPQRRAWLWWLAYNLALLGSFAAFYTCFLAAHAAQTSGSWLEDYWRDSFPPHTGVAACLWWLLKVHTGRMLAYPVGGDHFASAATTVLCLIGAWRLIRQRRGRTLLMLLAAPALLTLIAAAMHRYPYGGSVRVSIHLAPAICLLAGAGAAALIDYCRSERRRSAAGALVAGALVILPIAGGVRDVLHPFKSPEDLAIRRAAADFARQVLPGEQVGIHNSPFGTYGPPDGPIFHQSLRYYLQLYTGVSPRWRTDGTWGPDVNWILVFRGPGFGPSRQRVEELAAQAGLRVQREQRFPLLPPTDAALVAYRCTPGTP